MPLEMIHPQPDLSVLLNEPLPRLRRIEESLRTTEPEQIEAMTQGDPRYIFPLDYYFRCFSYDIGERIINFPELSSSTLLELFNMQIIRSYAADISGLPTNDLFPVSLDSYWTRINHPKLQLIFKILMDSGESNRTIAVGLMGKLSLEDLSAISEEQANVLLDFVKRRRELLPDLITRNLDLYDFMNLTARKHKDDELTEHLGRYAALAVQLRFAQDQAQEARSLIDDSGRIPFVPLVELIKKAPRESLEYLLTILVREGYVEEKIRIGLHRFLEK